MGATAFIGGPISWLARLLCLVMCMALIGAGQPRDDEIVSLSDTLKSLPRSELNEVLEVSLILSWEDGVTLDKYVQFAGLVVGPDMDGDALLLSVISTVDQIPDRDLVQWILSNVPEEILAEAMFGDKGGANSPVTALSDTVARFFEAEVSAGDLWSLLDGIGKQGSRAIELFGSDEDGDHWPQVDDEQEKQLKGIALYLQAQFLLFHGQAVNWGQPLPDIRNADDLNPFTGTTSPQQLSDETRAGAYAAAFEKAIAMLIDSAQYFGNNDALALIALLHFSKVHAFSLQDPDVPLGVMAVQRLGIRKPLKMLHKVVGGQC